MLYSLWSRTKECCPGEWTEDNSKYYPKPHFTFLFVISRALINIRNYSVGMTPKLIMLVEYETIYTCKSGLNLKFENNLPLMFLHYYALWLAKKKKKLLPLSNSERSKTKTNPDSWSRTFIHASWPLYAFASSFDWFTGLSLSFAMTKLISLGLVLRRLNWKLLYSNSFNCLKRKNVSVRTTRWY